MGLDCLEYYDTGLRAKFRLSQRMYLYLIYVCTFFFMAAGIGCLTYYYYNPVLMENVNAHIAMVTKNHVE